MRLAIIGGGFSAAALLHRLVRQHAGGTTGVVLYEPRPQPGEGVAYGDASDELLLNTRAGAMGVDADQPGGFADWAGLGPDARDVFLPRRRYAQYLRGVMEADIAAASFSVQHQRACATSVLRDAAGFLVDSATGSARFDAVVLAIGALSPRAAVGQPASDERIIDRVWPSTWCQRVQPDDHVVVLGTGLTMVDQFQQLQSAGHRGRVTAVSRRGLLPQVHAPRHGTPPDGAVIAMLAAQPSLRALARTLRRQLQSAPDWRDVLDALRPHHRAIWMRLSPRERRAFLRHLRPWWDTHRHRLAPEVGALLDGAKASGRLRVVAAAVESIEPNDDAIAVELRHRRSGSHEVLQAALVLRATGFELAVRPGCDPLLDALLAAGLVAPDPHGLGLQVDAHCRALDARGRPVDGLHVLGPMLAGQHWEATAVPDIRIDAATIARTLCDTPAVRDNPM